MTVASVRVGRAWATNVVLCLLGCGLVALARQFVVESDHFVMGFSGVSGWSAILYVAAVAVVLTQPVNRATLWIVIGFAIACRLMTLFAEPFLSTDIYRYVWDGVVQHAHVSPYRYVPGDPALTFLRAPNQDVFDNINRRDYAHTIYPPVAQMVYYVVTFFSPTVTAMKFAMVGFECVTVGVLMALLRATGRPTAEVLLYAWCPLLVWEIGGSGHVDAVVIAFVALALLFRYRENPVLTGVFLGLAVMTKFYPLVLVPALWMRKPGKLGDLRMPAAMAAVIAAGYAVYASVGMKVFGFLMGYTKEEGIDSGARFFLLELLQHMRGLAWVPVRAYLVFCAVAMGGMGWWAWKVSVVGAGGGALPRAIPYPAAQKARVEDEGPGVEAPKFLWAGMGLGFAMMLLFSPHYPWYVIWLIPFFVLTPNVALLAYLMAFFYGFTTQWADPGPKMFFLNEWIYGFTTVAISLHFVLRRWPVLGVFDCRGERRDDVREGG